MRRVGRRRSPASAPEEEPAASRDRAPCYGEAVAQPNAASRSPAGPGGVSIPRLLIDTHLRDFHGAGLRVCLALCGRQARAGRSKHFPYSIPRLMEATGLSERAVGMALGALEKRRLIERQKNPGPTGNRYRIVWEEPTATNEEPIPASTYEPVSAKTDAPGPEEAARVASEMSQGSRAGSQGPENPLPDLVRPVEAVDSHEPEPAAATNTEAIPARETQSEVPSSDLFGDYFKSEEADAAASETTPPRRARSRRPERPPSYFVKQTQLIDDDPEPTTTTPAEGLEKQGAGRRAKKNRKPEPPKT